MLTKEQRLLLRDWYAEDKTLMQILDDIDELRGKIDQLCRIIDVRGCACEGTCVDCQEYVDVCESMEE